MSKTFTYVIRSDSRTNQADNTNSCTIRLNCPSNYQYYDCEVDSFYMKTKLSNGDAIPFKSATIELRAQDLQFVNGNDTKNRNLTSLCFYSLNSFISSNISFRVSNFNTKEIKFQLLDEENDLLLAYSSNTDYDEPWVLVLKMTGVEDA